MRPLGPKLSLEKLATKILGPCRIHSNPLCGRWDSNPGHELGRLRSFRVCVRRPESSKPPVLADTTRLQPLG